MTVVNAGNLSVFVLDFLLQSFIFIHLLIKLFARKQTIINNMAYFFFIQLRVIYNTYTMVKEIDTLWSWQDTWQKRSSFTCVGTCMSGSFPRIKSSAYTFAVQFTLKSKVNNKKSLRSQEQFKYTSCVSIQMYCKTVFFYNIYNNYTRCRNIKNRGGNSRRTQNPNLHPKQKTQVRISEVQIQIPFRQLKIVEAAVG